MSYQQHQQHQHAVAAPRPRRPGPGAYEYAPAAPAPAATATATATARYTPHAPTPMTGRVIVDRTSFDSEDHVTSNHFAPHSSASTGGPSLASFHGGGGGGGGGGAAPGHGTAGATTAGGAMHLVSGGSGGGGDDGESSEAPAASSAPPKKLRRRKMKWKPRLPSSSSGTSADNTGNATSTGGRAASGKVTFQRATDDSTVSPDDMSYIEGRGGGGTGQSKKKGGSAKYVGGSGGGQASIASTNATPRLSNQAWAANGSGKLLAGLRARSRANHAILASGDDSSTLATLETPVHRTGGGAANITTGSNRNSVSITDSGVKFTPYGERQRGRNNVVTTTPNKFGWVAAPGGTQMASSSAATPGDRSTSSTAPLEESFTSLDHSGYSTPSRGRSSTGGTPRDEKHPLPPRVPPMDIMGGATPPRHSRDRISPASSQRMRALSLRVENNSRLSGAASSIVATNDATAGRNQPDNSTTSVGGSGSGSYTCNLLRLDGAEDVLRLDGAKGISLVSGDGSSKMVSVPPISRELAMLQAQSEGNVLTPSRQQQGQGGNQPAKGAPPPLPPPQAGTSRSRFASAVGPVDVDSAQFTDAERHLRAIHEMGAEHLIHGEFDEAVEVFTEILRGQMERHGPGHPRVGTALHNLGICHMKKGDYASAIRVCRDAVEIRKAALGGRHPDVAVSLAQLGIAHLECGQHRKALVAFREALQIRRMLLGPKHPKVARLLNNTGCALFELNEMRGAMLAFEETLDIQRSMMKSPDAAFGDDGSGSPSSSAAEQLLLSTAATLCNIGSIRLRLGDADGAIVALEEALLVQQSVLGDNHQIVLATADSIGFIEIKRGKGSRHASGNSSLAGDNFSDSPGCAPPPLLSRMINANVVQSIGAGGKSLFQRMEELTLEQMACGGGIDRSDAETQFSI